MSRSVEKCQTLAKPELGSVGLFVHLAFEFAFVTSGFEEQCAQTTRIHCRMSRGNRQVSQIFLSFSQISQIDHTLLVQSSMEWLLRCRIHFELAKCEEEIEQLQVAEQHLIKAIRLDDERMYAESLEHNLKRLRLRGELYKTPEKLEDQAAMIIEQCVVGLKGKEKRLKPAIGEPIKQSQIERDQHTFVAYASCGLVGTERVHTRA